MCLFGRRAATPVVQPPPPIQPSNPDVVAASKLPSKKELLDPDDVAGVENGTGNKKGILDDSKGAAKKTGTDALKININTGTGGESGGLNV